MSKLFYTDPLKAAWMAREFGVKFISHGGADLIYNGGDDFSVIDCPRGHYVGEYYHVSPDSLPIFEPKVGDKDEDGYVYEEKKLAWLRKDGLYDNDPVYGYRHTSEIAKRDNKPFFMPEVES